MLATIEFLKAHAATLQNFIVQQQAVIQWFMELEKSRAEIIALRNELAALRASIAPHRN